MPTEKLDIEKTFDPAREIETLTIRGPLTLATLFEFQTALREAAGPKTLIDLTGVPYMDSAGLGAVLSFYASTQRRGTRYAIARMAQRILVMFRASKVDQFLSIYPTVEEAQQALQ